MSITYTRDYILIANFLGMALIPFAILAVLNFRLYRKIKVSVHVTFCICTCMYFCIGHCVFGMALVPFAILAVLNFRLYRKIKVFVFANTVIVYIYIF